MLHHLSIAVSDLNRASTFYDAVLEPLGYVQVFADDEAVGYGYAGGDDKLCLKLAEQVMKRISPFGTFEIFRKYVYSLYPNYR